MEATAAGQRTQRRRLANNGLPSCPSGRTATRLSVKGWRGIAPRRRADRLSPSAAGASGSGRPASTSGSWTYESFRFEGPSSVKGHLRTPLNASLALPGNHASGFLRPVARGLGSPARQREECRKVQQDLRPDLRACASLCRTAVTWKILESQSRDRRDIKRYRSSPVPPGTAGSHSPCLAHDRPEDSAPADRLLRGVQQERGSKAAWIPNPGGGGKARCADDSDLAMTLVVRHPERRMQRP